VCRHDHRPASGMAHTSMSVVAMLLVLALSVLQTQSIVNPTYNSIANSTASLYIGNAYPSSLISLSNAVPVVMNPVDNKVLVSTASYGYGRVIVFSHEAMLINNSVLLRNAAVWAADRAYAKPGTLGVAYLESSNDVSQGVLPAQVRGSSKLFLDGIGLSSGGPMLTSTMWCRLQQRRHQA
jgi:hypothetical protein